MAITTIASIEKGRDSRNKPMVRGQDVTTNQWHTIYAAGHNEALFADLEDGQKATFEGYVYAVRASQEERDWVKMIAVAVS